MPGARRKSSFPDRYEKAFDIFKDPEPTAARSCRRSFPVEGATGNIQKGAAGWGPNCRSGIDGSRHPIKRCKPRVIERAEK